MFSPSEAADIRQVMQSYGGEDIKRKEQSVLGYVTMRKADSLLKKLNTDKPKMRLPMSQMGRMIGKSTEKVIA